MAIQSAFFPVEAGVRTYISTKYIASKQNMAVWLQKASFTPPEEEWEVMYIGGYDLINNTAVLTQALDPATYTNLEVRVADTPNELTNSPSAISVVASMADEIHDVASDPLRQAILDLANGNLDNFVSSDVDDTPGSNRIVNMVSITQADYDLLTPDADTFYVIVEEGTP